MNAPAPKSDRKSRSESPLVIDPDAADVEPLCDALAAMLDDASPSLDAVAVALGWTPQRAAGAVEDAVGLGLLETWDRPGSGRSVMLSASAAEYYGLQLVTQDTAHLIQFRWEPLGKKRKSPRKKHHAGSKTALATDVTGFVLDGCGDDWHGERGPSRRERDNPGLAERRQQYVQDLEELGESMSGEKFFDLDGNGNADPGNQLVEIFDPGVDDVSGPRDASGVMLSPMPPAGEALAVLEEFESGEIERELRGLLALAGREMEDSEIERIAREVMVMRVSRGLHLLGVASDWYFPGETVGVELDCPSCAGATYSPLNFCIRCMASNLLLPPAGPIRDERQQREDARAAAREEKASRPKRKRGRPRKIA